MIGEIYCTYTGSDDGDSRRGKRRTCRRKGCRRSRDYRGWDSVEVVVMSMPV